MSTVADDSDSSTDCTENVIKLNIKELCGNQFFVKINSKDIVFTLKSKIETIRNICPSKQRLIFAAQELIDSEPLSNYNLSDGRTVHLVMRKHDSQQTYGSTVVADNNHSCDENVINENARFLHNASVLNDIQGSGHVIAEEDQLRIIDVIEMVRASKLIRLFSIIDCLLMLIFGLWSYFLLIGIPFALCGYFGAKKLKRSLLMIYVAFIVVAVGFRIVLVYFYFSWLMVILTVISIVLEVYILKQTVFLVRYIPRLTEHDYNEYHNRQNGFI